MAKAAQTSPPSSRASKNKIYQNSVIPNYQKIWSSVNSMTGIWGDSDYIVNDANPNPGAGVVWSSTQRVDGVCLVVHFVL